MFYLILSILTATSLVIILRLFDRWKIQTAHGIVFNYLVCCLTGIVAMDDRSQLLEISSWNGWWICLILGVWFIVIFLLIGRCVQIAGVAITSIAFKLSFIIPAVSAILFYGDNFTFYKAIGILIAMLAVYFITYEPEGEIANPTNGISEENGRKAGRLERLLPLAIFIGAGLNDAFFNFIQRNYSPPGFDHLLTITVFAGAFMFGIILYGRDKALYQWKNLAGGILLGIPNYASLYFLLQALKHTGFPPSTLFPVNNLGIVCLSAFVGLVFFHEQFSKRKLSGFLLAIVCILLIGFVK